MRSIVWTVAKSRACRIHALVITVFLCGTPVYADLPTYWGMFDHAAGYVTDDQGNHLEWAWWDGLESPGCSRLYLNTGTWFDWSTGGYERYCVREGWIRLMGWTSRDEVTGETVFLSLKSEGEDGQKYAKVDDSNPYAFSVSVEMWYQGRIIRRYLDSQTWSGRSQQETFIWLDGSEAGQALQSYILMAPRSRFDRVWNSFIAPQGNLTTGSPLHTVALWTW